MSKVQAAQDALSEKETELKELKSQKAKEQGLVSQEDHEAQRLSLQADINGITARMADLQRKHEKTCTEVSLATSFCVCVCACVRVFLCIRVCVCMCVTLCMSECVIVHISCMWECAYA